MYRAKIVLLVPAVIVLFAAANIFALGVVITELHRDPSAGNKTAIPGGYSHSFVEIANFGSDTFFIRDVFLTNGKAVDSIMLFDAPIAGHDSCRFGAAYLPPGGFAVVLPQNYISGIAAAPSTMHPIAAGAAVLTVNRKNLCGGLANDDGVALYRGTRSQIDSLIDLAADPDVYVSAPLSGKIVLSQKQAKGVSVVPASLLLGEKKYVPSPKEPLTPGRYEPYQSGVYLEYSASMASAAVRCSIAGVFAEKSENASWRFYYYTSTSGAGVTGVAEIGRGRFNSQRQFLLTFDIAPEPRQYAFEINAATFPVDLSSFWAAAGALRVTEIYPRGSASIGEPEWFEVQNVSPAEVNLNGWMFGKASDTAVIAAYDIFLPPGQFIAVSRDTAAMREKYRAIPIMAKPARWITLNNYSDTVCLFSPRGIMVDMAVYRSAWFSGWATAYSLERVSAGTGRDSASWALCHRPTPGFPGAADRWRSVSAPSMEIGPTPFTPNGDGIDDRLSIRIKSPPQYKAKIKIFSFNGKLLKTFTGEKEQLYWDGTTEKSRPAPPGPIYVIAEFTSSGGKRKTIKKNGILWR
jgi:gliding motility-associated-like protein